MRRLVELEQLANDGEQDAVAPRQSALVSCFSSDVVPLARVDRFRVGLPERPQAAVSRAARVECVPVTPMSLRDHSEITPRSLQGHSKVTPKE